MKNTLYVMCGIPGSGKSTFAKSQLPNALYVSRDKVRYNMVAINEAYFSKEDEVFKVFVNAINEGLAAGADVIADATHLNPQSRAKLFSRLKIDTSKTQVIAIFMNTPYKTCLKRNEYRKGTREYVPPAQIEKMYKSLKKPSSDEYYGIINKVYIITPKE